MTFEAYSSSLQRAATEAHGEVSKVARRKVLKSIWDNLLCPLPGGKKVVTWHDLKKIEREIFVHYCEQGLIGANFGIKKTDSQSLVADAQYDHDQLNKLADEAVQADAMVTVARQSLGMPLSPSEVPDYNCSGCGRHELECSENPCDDVVRDREEEYSQGELF